MGSMERPTLMTGGSSPHPVRQVFDDPAHPVGTIGAFSDGRVFYYASSIGAAILPGQVCQVAQNDTNTAVINPTSNAVATTKILDVTLGGSSTFAKDYFSGGFVTVQNLAGAGYFYRISGF